jgi:hypothetical protein
VAGLYPFTFAIDALLAFSRWLLRCFVVLLPGVLCFGGIDVSTMFQFGFPQIVCGVTACLLLD